MFAKSRTINRQYIGKNMQNFMDLPNLIDIQLSSYESFLQKEKLDKHEPLAEQGLEEVFRSTFPIDSPNGDMTLEYEFYELALSYLRYTVRPALSLVMRKAFFPAALFRIGAAGLNLKLIRRKI